MTRVDVHGRPTFLQIAGVTPVSFGYDSRGRIATLTQGTGADNRSLTMGYGADGFLESITDALNRQIVYQRDPAGRVHVATLPGARQIGLGWDANGNLTAVTPPDRAAHEFQFTAVDTLAEYDPPPAGLPVAKTVYGYNTDKQLVSISRADGLSLALGYDGLGRLATLTPSQGGGDAITYTYSPSTGRVASIASAGTPLAYAYDGSLPKQETWSGSVSATVSWTYDSISVSQAWLSTDPRSRAATITTVCSSKPGSSLPRATRRTVPSAVRLWELSPRCGLRPSAASRRSRPPRPATRFTATPGV